MEKLAYLHIRRIRWGWGPVPGVQPWECKLPSHSGSFNLGLKHFLRDLGYWINSFSKYIQMSSIESKPQVPRGPESTGKMKSPTDLKATILPPWANAWQSRLGKWVINWPSRPQDPTPLCHSLHIGARSPPLCPQSAGWALKGWNMLSNKGQGEDWYRMETEALEWGKVWRLMGGDRWKEKLLEKVKCWKGNGLHDASQNNPDSLHPQSHTLIFLRGQSMCFYGHRVLPLTRGLLKNTAASFPGQKFNTLPIERFPWVFTIRDRKRRIPSKLFSLSIVLLQRLQGWLKN